MSSARRLPLALVGGLTLQSGSVGESRESCFIWRDLVADVHGHGRCRVAGQSSRVGDVLIGQEALRKEPLQVVAVKYIVLVLGYQDQYI